MSKSLGEHEVEREDYSENFGVKSGSVNARIARTRERVVTPAEIASLPHLTGYVAFAGDRPITRVTLKPINFRQHTARFREASTFSRAAALGSASMPTSS